MDRPRCPGQDMRYWKPGDIFTVNCPACSAEIEFFKDEPALLCPACKIEVRNPKIDLGCAKWCKFAEQCIGPIEGESAQASVADRLIVAVEKGLGLPSDARERAQLAMGYARRIVSADGGDPLIVQAAVLFNEADRHSRTSFCRPGQPGDACQTKDVLERAGLPAEAIARVCQILWALHTGLEDDSLEFAAVWDATQLLNLAPIGQTPIQPESFLRTDAGRLLASEILAGKPYRQQQEPL